tara:strand:- start:26559 stop:27191 length:633 start_codon:yes stop_codon:yes gene_type:complete
MDLKTRIRVALGIEEETTQLAYEGKLADGTIIVSEADALAEGVAVSVLVEDGTQIPLPVGEYETEEGVKFVVEEEGVISSMVEETEAKDEDEDEEMYDEKEEMSNDNAELFAEIGAVVKELLEEVRNDIARLNSELDELRGENLAKDENIAELQEENTNLSAQVVELGKEPATEPVSLNKFAKNNNKVELSKAEYNKLSAKQRFFHNLNN